MKTKSNDAKRLKDRKSKAFRRELIAAMAFPEVRLAVWMGLNELERGAMEWGRKFEGLSHIITPGPEGPQ